MMKYKYITHDISQNAESVSIIRQGQLLIANSNYTVGELRSGVTGFATIYATGSHRFMLQVRNDERDEYNLIQ